MLAELGGRLAALVRGFGRDRAQALDPGAPAALDGGAAVALVEERCGSLEASSLGEAMGLALAGRRVAAVIEEGDVPFLPAVADHCAPMVAWLPLPGGHAAWHAASASGWVQLFASSVQEAVDLASVAHIVAERTLVPVLVGVDGPEVWEGIANVLLPRAGSFAAIDDEDAFGRLLPAGQRLIFGETRDRVPRWFDPDRPLAQGGARSGEAAAIGLISRACFTGAAVEGALDEVLARHSERTGRLLARCEAWHVADADVVIVAQGNAARVARSVGEQLRAKGPKVAVLAVNCLRPFPSAAVAAALEGRRVVVLERAADRLDGPAPLLSEVRAALSGGRPPKGLHSALWGLGGAPLRPTDLAALCREAGGKARSRVFLGVGTPTASALPKREARLQELHRAFPALHGAGLRIDHDEAVRAGWALGVVSRGGHVHGIARDAADLIHGVAGGHLAGIRLTIVGGRLDLVTVATAADPGASTLADVLLVADATLVSAAVAHLAPAGTLVVAWPGEPSSFAAALPTFAATTIHRLGATLVTLATTDPDRLLGGALAAATARGLFVCEPRLLRGARTRALGSADGAAARVTAMIEGLGGLQAIDLPHPAGVVGGPMPQRPAVRASANRDAPPVASLPMFLDRGVAGGPLTPDPLHAPGVLPALSAAFHDHRGDRSTFPVLDPGACTGCGRCWVACPDSSVGVAALDVQRVLERAMELCTRDGTRADALRPVLGKLAKEVAAGMAATEGRFSEVLAATWASFLSRLSPTPERGLSLHTAFEAVYSRLAPLSAVRCAPFFAAEPAELLVLAFDPDACKGCGACAAVCEPRAITMLPQATEPLAAARAQWRLWEELPDTSERTVARVRDRGEVSPLAALELSRHFAMAMAGGDAAEPGSGARLAVRAFLAVAEATLQRAQVARLGMLDALAVRLVEKAVLCAGNAAPHLRLTEAGRLVTALRVNLAEGPTGLGRARLGLVVSLDDETEWMAAFPDNSFAVPVQIAAPAIAINVARGLCGAMLATALEEARLVRWARVVADRPEEGDEVATKLRSLTWAELDAEERAAAPAVVLVGSATALDGVALPALAHALADPLPLRVLTLDRLAPGGRDALPLLSLAQDRAMLVQASLGAPAEFVSGVALALSHDGPSLIRTHAPSPALDGFAPSEVLLRMETALEERTFPAFRYDPRGPGVFGSRISLAGNPVTGGAGGRTWRVLQELAGVVTPFTARIREEALRDAQANARVEIDAARVAASADVAAARDRVTAELAVRVRARLLMLAGHGGPGNGSADV